MHKSLSIGVLSCKAQKWTPKIENKFILMVSELPQRLEKQDIKEKGRGVKGGWRGGEGRGEKAEGKGEQKRSSQTHTKIMLLS